MLSDEGLNIYEASSGRTVLIDTVPWETEDFGDAVAEILSRKVKSRSIALFNDMVEQHYRKERIPKVSVLDRASVVERRLTAAFPSYPMRASLKLKEKKVPGKAETAGDVYLFAAVPLSENVRKTFESIRRSHSTLTGFGLLPVESSSMVQALAKKLNKGVGQSAVWTIFVGQHASGGLRQVVIRNGELALTRMTPIIDSDSDPDVWGSEVVNEVKGTMSYLSRFGFDPSDGLDVIVISANSAADIIQNKIDFECNLSVLTATEAGGLLGVRIGAQKEQRYADPLHVAWLGKKKSLTLPVKSALISKIGRPAKIAMIAMLVLLALCGELGYRVYNSFSLWNKASSQIKTSQMTLDQTRVEHAAELERKKEIGVDFDRIDKATKAYKALDAKGMKPLVMLDTIGRAMGPDISLQSLKINLLPEPKPGEEGYVDPAMAYSDGTTPEGAAEAPAAGADVKSQKYQVILRIVFPVTLDPKIGVEQINGLMDRLKKAMPNHQIDLIKQVADLSYTGNYVGEATTGQGATNDQPLEAEIMITGAML